MADSYICGTCGKTHQGAPLRWGPDAPNAWAAMAQHDREKRGELGTDQCVIDEERFFIRGQIEIPVVDVKDVFAWLVWIEVSAQDFGRMSKLWTVAGREQKDPSHSGVLANELAIYEEQTLGLKVKLHTRPVGERPFVEVVADHKLRDEQRDGISSHHVQDIADKLMG